MRARPLHVLALALPLLVVASCAGPAPSGRARAAETRVERAVPEADPAGRATAQGPLVLSRAERVVVKVEPKRGGGLRVVEFLSPDLTEAEKAELEDAIERGELKPDTEAGRTGTTWTTTVVRRRR